MIAFSLPVEAIGKARPRFVKATGRIYTPARTEAFEQMIAFEASRAMGGQQPMRGPLRMTIRATYLHPESWSAKKMAATAWKASRPDWDNIGKLCADAMNRIVYSDDAQIVEATVQKKYGVKASLVIEVSEVGDDG